MVLADIKVISPTVCMHKIFMEESYKLSIKHLRRLNPTMKEVVRVDAWKQIKVGIIFAISDCAWDSPV